ncbi:hypothetical protein, partial [Desulfovibrio sp.]|uniref:hypothetical protein n=1 Tax=Desulfovibrio sp. TaxID=885 RepID=UPI0030779BF2
MTTPWRHGRRWMFRKRNSISKRSYRRTGRASSKRPSPDEKYLSPAKNILFPIKNKGGDFSRIIRKGDSPANY